jgi:hypothetical protein
MVLPLIPLIAGAAIGGAGVGLGSMFGGKKEEIIHAPYEYYAPTTSEIFAPTYAPQTQYAPVTSYGYQGATYIISSPEAVSKKELQMEVESIPKQEAVWTFPITTTQEPSHVVGAGTDLTKLAIIGVIGIIAYAGITSVGKKKKK